MSQFNIFGGTDPIPTFPKVKTNIYKNGRVWITTDKFIDLLERRTLEAYQCDIDTTPKIKYIYKSGATVSLNPNWDDITLTFQDFTDKDLKTFEAELLGILIH